MRSKVGGIKVRGESGGERTYRKEWKGIGRGRESEGEEGWGGEDGESEVKKKGKRWKGGGWRGSRMGEK